MNSLPVLTLLLVLPLAASLLVAFIKDDLMVRRVTLGASILELLLALPLLGFTPDGGFQFVEKVTWVAAWDINYHLAVDGISILMIWLTVATLPMCVLCSWTYIGQRIKEFHICLLLMTAACIGVFAAMDFVLFWVCWEAMLIPMYLLIAVWGGDDRRYASIKFFIYTLAGSTLLLAAIVAFRVVGGTFSIPDLMNTSFSFRFQFWAFLAMALAFAVKVPMFPFHTWLPAAHVQAPSAGSVILAAVLLKMGAYGFLRFCLPMTPMASEYFAPLMIGISIVSILYGGFVALGQSDIKKLVAYSSVAHMGFVTLGIFLFDQQGVQGALLQMLNHGIITGALFMMIGTIYERSHSREISKNLGLGKYLPAFMGFWGLFALASLSFPGTNGFVGEVLVFAAAFRVDPIVGALIVPGALLGAAYMFRVSLKMAWGTPASPVADDDHGHDAHAEAAAETPAEAEAGHGDDHGGHGHHDDDRQSKWPDLNKREWTYLVIPAVMVLMIGLAPTPFLGLVTPSVDKLLSDHSIRSNKVVQVRIDGSTVAKSSALARSAVQLVLEPGSAGTTTDTTPAAVSGTITDVAPVTATMTVAANQGESQ
ncbi:NADH-quinone oxidoreductase subunit M [Desulfovibrio sp. OttesenSCG-928-O18]|nr:NADH-quinone oxidoreductase subunit M [Desulfovibrio sp. OttesenSCG-928-O18]